MENTTMENDTIAPSLPYGAAAGDAENYRGKITKYFRGTCPGGTMAYYYNFEKVHKTGPWKEVR